MSRKQAARSRPGKAEVERKRDERAARRALARERRNRAQDEGEHDGGGLNEQLRALGLRLREVPGDGNCLFRALGDQLEGHSRNHLKHRQDTVAYMIQQRADFEPFVEDDVPFEKHIASLAQPGTFAGNDAIVAFARNNQVNIVIHQQNAPLWQIHGTDKSNARELHIAYRYGEHYDSVRKINDNSAAPAWLQTEMLCQNESPNEEAPQAKGERQQPKAERQDEMDDALQKVYNATGCSDVSLIAQVLEAEGYSIESAIFAVFQMKELEKLRASRDEAVSRSPGAGGQRCCYDHDCCYENLHRQGCHPYIDHYRYLIINNKVLCKYKNRSVCATLACECDKHASVCFRREAPTYNRKLRHFPAVMCKEVTPKCFPSPDF